LNYESTDASHPSAKKIYYRLRQIDFNEKESFSPIRMVNYVITNIAVSAYPNPVENSLHVILPKGYSVGTVDVIRTDGAAVKHFALDAENTIPSLDVADLPVGVYQLMINCQEGISTCRFVKY
jgi:hypothetical protein